MTLFLLMCITVLGMWCWALSSRNFELHERLFNLEYPKLQDSEILATYLAEVTDVPKKRPSTKKRPLKGAKK